MAKFDPNRVRPGTIELVRDSSGNYTTKVVGLETINSLSLPDISTTAAVTKTDTDTKTATDITGDTLQSQTQMAFKTGGDNQIDTTGSMLQDEAKKTSDMLANVSTPTTIQDSMIRSNRFDADTFDDQVGSRIEEPTRIESPTEKVFRSDTQRFKEEFDPTKVDSRLAVDKELKGSAAVQRGEIEPPGFDFSFLGGDRFKGGDGSTTRAAKEADFASGMIGSDTSATRAAKEADFASGTLGITTVKPTETALDTQKFAGSTTGTLSDPAEKQDVKPEVKPSALETVSTSLRSAFKNIKTPMMMVVDAIGTPRNETEAAVNFNKSYFNVRDDGRIAGNPATDLFAGMNRVSAFGNLNQAGAKRIARREKTISTKNVSDKFKRDTEKMKEQLNDYREGRAAARDKEFGNTKTNVTGFGKTGLGRDTSQGGGDTGQDSGGKIVCTMMNESYGFGSFRNKIWLRHSKNLAPEYQIGYHRIFLPLVKKAKTNKIIKKILEHIAIHRTIDIRQEEKNKIHLLGRVYRTILEPICYLVGKI